MSRVLRTLLIVSIVSSQDPVLDRCLNTAKTQLEMNTCAGDAAASMDGRMNDELRAVLRLAENRETAAKIEAAQRAWIAYRDAYLEAIYPGENKQELYGSSYPMNANLTRAELTAAQIAALQRLRDRYSRK